MYSQTECVGVHWNPMWSPDESLSAVGSYILFLELAGFSVFQANITYGKKRSIGYLDEFVRTCADLAWVILFVLLKFASLEFLCVQTCTIIIMINIQCQ